MCPCPALPLATRQSPPPALASVPTVRMRRRTPTSARKASRVASITENPKRTRRPPAKKPDHPGHSTAANVAPHAPETANPPLPATKADGVKVGVRTWGLHTLFHRVFRNWPHLILVVEPLAVESSAAMPPLTHPRSDCSRFQRPMPAPSFARAPRTTRRFKDRSTRSKYATPRSVSPPPPCNRWRCAHPSACGNLERGRGGRVWGI